MNDFTIRAIRCATIFCLAIACAGLLGCRQPGSSPSNGSALSNFGQLPGSFNSSQFASAAIGNSGWGNTGYGNSGIGNSNLGFGGSGNTGKSGGLASWFGGLFGKGKNQQSNGSNSSGYQNNYTGNGYDRTASQGNQYGGSGGGVPDLQINDGSQLQQYANNAANQVQNLNQKVGAYDADNQLLNTEVAGLQQKLQLANQYNQGLKEQLAGTSSQMQQSFSARQAAAQQVANLERQLDAANQSLRLAQQQNQNGGGQLVGYGNNNGAPTRLAGGATIRANNSLLNRLSAIQIPGGQARLDGDVIRVEFPSDLMFVPGTYQIQPAQMPLLQNIVGTIRESFPRQIVGIEAHWDKTPLSPPGTTDHQLTATQALSVFENLTRLGLPENQLFTMAMASNRPRHRQSNLNGISPNRRIELVIYPETYDGS